MGTEQAWLGIILWASKDGENGVLADSNGNTWRFRERLPIEGTEVYQNGWRPQISVETIPETGKERIITEPSIVWFTIRFFQYHDGRSGHNVMTIEAAENVPQEHATALQEVWDKWYEEKNRAKKGKPRPSPFRQAIKPPPAAERLDKPSIEMPNWKCSKHGVVRSKNDPEGISSYCSMCKAGNSFL